MAKDKYDEGKYRLTSVGDTGAATTKIYKSWKKCQTHYAGLVRLSHVRYAIIVDQTDMDSRAWSVRSEYHRTLKPGFI